MPAPTILPFGDDAIARAAALIAAGEPVAVPTETVYGLATDATDPAAVARIYAAKGRPSFNPLIVHVLDLAAAERLAVFDGDARTLAAAFWPGPLTLVLPVRDDAGLAAAVTAGLPTVAIRVPAGRAMRALLAASGVPLAAPSANRSGAISPTTAPHVAASLGGRVPLILDDGACAAGVESTIVAGREVLRPGPITTAAITMLLPLCERGAPAAMQPDAGAQLPPPKVIAPGQLASHYAPAKPLRLNATSAAADEWLIGFGGIAGNDTLSATGDLAEAAATLFAALHRADAAPHPRIAVAPVPEEGIGEAINDRLKRAAHRDGDGLPTSAAAIQNADGGTATGQTPVRRADWRAFLREIAIVVIGVLLALAGQQWADGARWKSAVADFRDAADKELAADLAAYRYRVDQSGCVDRRIAELRRWRHEARAGRFVALSREIGRPALITQRTSVWNTRTGDLMAKIPLERRLAYSSLYDELANNDRQMADEREAWRSLSGFAAASTLTNDDVIRLSELLYRAATINVVLRSNQHEVDAIAGTLALRPGFGTRYIAPRDPGFCRPLS